MNFVRTTESVGAPVPPIGSLRPRRKWPISYDSVSAVAIACDIASILICGILAGTLYNLAEFGTPGVVFYDIAAATVVAVFFVSLIKSRDLYNPVELLDLKSQIRNVCAAWVSVFLFLFGAVFTLKIGAQFSRIAMFSFAFVGLGCLVAQRALYRGVLTRGLSGQKFSGRNAILITDDAAVANSGRVSMLLKHGFNLERQFVLPALERDHQQQKMISDIVGYLRGSDVEEVIVIADLTRWGELSKLLAGLRKLPLPVNFIPVGAASDILSRPSHVLGDSVCIELQRGPLGTFERGIKRSIDVCGVVAGLVLLLPLLAITAVMIKLDSPGPVLFRQGRCGFNGRRFNIFKFRTMTVMEDGTQICQAEQSDLRVTRLGKLLRRSSIDELPQLINVINGTMSLVGPRPHAVAHDNHFDKLVGNYAFRHHVKPGLTGWAQVNGCRGPTPTVAEIRRRVEYDLWYIDNWSLRLDLRIIFRTVIEVMRGRNAY